MPPTVIGVGLLAALGGRGLDVGVAVALQDLAVVGQHLLRLQPLALLALPRVQPKSGAGPATSLR